VGLPLCLAALAVLSAHKAVSVAPAWRGVKQMKWLTFRQEESQLGNI
jgi:hypothetical protein